MGGAKPPSLHLPGLGFRSAWQGVLRVVSAPPQDEKCPHFVEGRDEEDFVGKKFSGW